MANARPPTVGVAMARRIRCRSIADTRSRREAGAEAESLREEVCRHHIPLMMQQTRLREILGGPKAKDSSETMWGVDGQALRARGGVCSGRASPKCLGHDWIGLGRDGPGGVSEFFCFQRNCADASGRAWWILVLTENYRLFYLFLSIISFTFKDQRELDTRMQLSIWFTIFILRSVG